MGRKKSIPVYKPLSINLDSLSDEDLRNLDKDNEFKELLYEEMIKVFEHTAKFNLPKSTLFNIHNLDITVSAKKDSYKPIIENIIKYYTLKEDYDKCIKLTKLKEIL